MFSMFFQVFGRVCIHSDPFGPIRMRSDAFGCIRKQMEGFGKIRKNATFKRDGRDVYTTRAGRFHETGGTFSQEVFSRPHGPTEKLFEGFFSRPHGPTEHIFEWF